MVVRGIWGDCQIFLLQNKSTMTDAIDVHSCPPDVLAEWLLINRFEVSYTFIWQYITNSHHCFSRFVVLYFFLICVILLCSCLFSTSNNYANIIHLLAPAHDIVSEQRSRHSLLSSPMHIHTSQCRRNICTANGGRKRRGRN